MSNGKLATITIVIMFILLLLFGIGYQFIPGFEKDGWLSSGVQTSLLIELISFIVTAAFIAPLTAQVVRWREDKDWENSRRAAYLRIADALNCINSNFFALLETQVFLENKQGEDHSPITDMFIKRIRTKRVSKAKELKHHFDKFFSIYTSEQPSYTSGMHKILSEIRSELIHIEPTIHKLYDCFVLNRAQISLDRTQLDKIRLLLNEPKLDTDVEPYKIKRVRKPGGKPTVVIDESEPIRIERDREFARSHKLTFDVGVVLNRENYGEEPEVMGLNWELISNQWKKVSSQSRGNAAPIPIGGLSMSLDDQAKFLDKLLGEYSEPRLP